MKHLLVIRLSALSIVGQSFLFCGVVDTLPAHNMVGTIEVKDQCKCTDTKLIVVILHFGHLSYLFTLASNIADLFRLNTSTVFRQLTDEFLDNFTTYSKCSCSQEMWQHLDANLDWLFVGGMHLMYLVFNIQSLHIFPSVFGTGKPLYRQKNGSLSVECRLSLQFSCGFYDRLSYIVNNPRFPVDNFHKISV